MVISQACDRCFSVKARCAPGLSGGACYRCYRLNHACTYSRKRGRPGRKPKTGSRPPSESESPTGSQGDDSQAVVAAQMHAPPTLPSEGPYVPQFSPDDVLEVCTFFSIGATLSLTMREKLYSRLCEAPLLLLDPFQAVAGFFLRKTRRRPSQHEADLSKCSSALQNLRTIQVRKEDVGSCLALGLSLMTFQRLMSAASASTICRFTLSLVEPWYNKVWDDDNLTMELTCLVYHDTVYSLFRRRIPVIQYRIRDPYLVDRNVGVCASLLPLLYRLCVLATAAPEGSDNRTSSRDNCFDELEREIGAWVPRVPSDILDHYSETELLLLMTQAHLNRDAALLALYRLRYPFAKRDDDAISLSISMTTELAGCLAKAKNLPPNVTFPLLMAGAEASTIQERHQVELLISSFKGAGFYPFISHLRELLARIWTCRDQSGGHFLFDLFDQYPDVSVLL